MSNAFNYMRWDLPPPRVVGASHTELGLSGLFEPVGAASLPLRSLGRDQEGPQPAGCQFLVTPKGQRTQ